MTRRYWFWKPYADFVARLRVPSGFVLLAAFAYLSAPDTKSLAYGSPVAVLGLLLRAWAAGHLAKNEQLAEGGPYAHLRNPLYLGTLLVAAGLAASSRSLLLTLIFAVFFVFVYLPVIELEEQHLRKIFLSYESYAERVPLLWPRLSAASSGASFQWSLYLRNQEYQALAGFLAAVALLVWKAYR